MGQANKRGTFEQRLELALHNKKIKDECNKANELIMKQAEIAGNTRINKELNSPMLVSAIAAIACRR